VRVFVASHSYTGNGAAVMLQAVLEHWVKTLGWTVDVLFSLKEELPAELARTGVTARTDITPKLYDFALVNTLVSLSYLEQLAPHVPTALWVHEGESIVWSLNFPPNKWRMLFELARKIIFQTPWQPDIVFRSFLPTYLHANVACVRNGVPPLPANITPQLRSGGKKRIVFVGGVYGRKRPQDVVDALLAMQRSDIECIFIGSTLMIDSIGSENVLKINSRPDIFVLAGELDRRSTLEYVASADAFCLPSADESQPIAPLEAAALGVPCVLTDLPPYVGIWKNGVNCLMHPVGHTALLRRNLAAVIDDPGIRGPMITESGNLVKQFSFDRFLQQFTTEMPA
jgi:glycosyltransferase involved in cell wall biosynthesis